MTARFRKDTIKGFSFSYSNSCRRKYVYCSRVHAGHTCATCLEAQVCSTSERFCCLPPSFLLFLVLGALDSVQMVTLHSQNPTRMAEGQADTGLAIHSKKLLETRGALQTEGLSEMQRAAGAMPSQTMRATPHPPRLELPWSRIEAPPSARWWCRSRRYW